MDAKTKSEMEDRLGHLSEYLDDISNHLTNNYLEDLEYYLENMQDEIKAFLRNVNNAMAEEEDE